MEQDAAVQESHLVNGGEVRREGLAEGCLGDVGVDVVAATEKLLELDIGWGHPLEDEVAGGEVAAESRDAV